MLDSGNISCVFIFYLTSLTVDYGKLKDENKILPQLLKIEIFIGSGRVLGHSR